MEEEEEGELYNVARFGIFGLRYVFNVCLCRFGKWAGEALFGLFGQAITAVRSVRLQFAREQLSTTQIAPKQA